jgi:F-type H+-transporting ATPase subunit epsilon
MEQTLAAQNPLRCVVVTPEKALLDEVVDFVVLPMYDGELGVLPGRAPLIGRLGYGELRIVQGKKTRRYYIDGGFAQVKNNVVTVLTARAIPAEEIKPDLVLENLKSAQRLTTTPAETEAQFKTQQRARAQLRIAHRVAEESGKSY